MPAKDIYYATVKKALVKDGWTITHDPFTLTIGLRNVFVDFGAERTLAAERGSEKIAVEIKSFLSQSDLRDLELALGQYVFYRSILSRVDPERKLFLAVTDKTYTATFEEPIARPALEDYRIALLTFNMEREVIVRWMP